MEPETGAQSSLRQTVDSLLAATEALQESIAREAAPAELVAAFARREIAFDAIREAVAAGGHPNAANRACLARVRALDAAMIEAGRARAAATRDERQELLRRRTAIQAHALREREQPRFVAVRA